MNIVVTQPEAPRVSVTHAEPVRIDVIHRRVEIEIIDLEA